MILNTTRGTWHWKAHYMRMTRDNCVFHCECLSLAISSLPLNLKWGTGRRSGYNIYIYIIIYIYIYTHTHTHTHVYIIYFSSPKSISLSECEWLKWSTETAAHCKHIHRIIIMMWNHKHSTWFCLEIWLINLFTAMMSLQVENCHQKYEIWNP